MTAALFLGFLAAVVAVVIGVIARYMSARAAFGVVAGLGVWFDYVRVLGYAGILANTSIRPPGVVFLAAPVLVFLILFVVRWSADARVLHAVPLWLLIGAQTFRIVVELFLHQLWVLGIVPKMLTFAGANVDIYIGASAPLIAWLSTRGRSGLGVAGAWTVLGLLALTNVVVRSVLTAPGPLHRIHAEVPNLMFSTFPFTFIPAFFVPLAVVLHVLAIREIRSLWRERLS